MTALVLAGVVSAVFGVAGMAKITALPVMRAAAGHLGFTVAAYRRIGWLELAGAVGVLIGLRLPWLGLAAAAGLLLLMAGGVLFHLRARDSPGRLLVPVTSAVLVVGYALAV